MSQNITIPEGGVSRTFGSTKELRVRLQGEEEEYCTFVPEEETRAAPGYFHENGVYDPADDHLYGYSEAHVSAFQHIPGPDGIDWTVGIDADYQPHIVIGMYDVSIDPGTGEPVVTIGDVPWGDIDAGDITIPYVDLGDWGIGNVTISTDPDTGDVTITVSDIDWGNLDIDDITIDDVNIEGMGDVDININTDPDTGDINVTVDDIPWDETGIDGITIEGVDIDGIGTVDININTDLETGDPIVTVDNIPWDSLGIDTITIDGVEVEGVGTVDVTIGTDPDTGDVDVTADVPLDLDDVLDDFDLDDDFSVSIDPNDLDIGLAGTDLNGDDIAIELDVDGNTTEYGLPASIEIATNPIKLDYVDGEPIDATGLSVVILDEDGNLWQHPDYPFSTIVYSGEAVAGGVHIGGLILHPTQAKIEEATPGGYSYKGIGLTHVEYASDGSIMNCFSDKTGGTLGPYTMEISDNPSLQNTRVVIRENGSIIFNRTGPRSDNYKMWVAVYNLHLMPYVQPDCYLSIDYREQGYHIRWQSISLSTNGLSYNPDKNTQEIGVSWSRLYDGKMLETSFPISVEQRNWSQYSGEF